MKYLVTGWPRTRTAWLSMVLGAEHDVMVSVRGICNPMFACFHPVSHRVPVVYLERDSQSSKEAMEEWTGIALPDPYWAQIELCQKQFRLLNPNALVVNYESLQDTNWVMEIADFVGVELEHELVEQQQRIYVSQRLPR